MRSPIEIWTREHREVYKLIDALSELLSPDDIQARLVADKETALRNALAENLKKLADFAQHHFISEEENLFTAIREHLDIQDPKIKNALGCFTREHAQMHVFAERINELLPFFESGEKLEANIAAEVLRVSFGLQTIIRHHCTKEERDIYPLVEKLPPKVVFKMMSNIGGDDVMSLDHLIKPLGPKPDDIEDLEGMEGPEN